MKKNVLFILVLLLLFSPVYCWEMNQKGGGKKVFEVISSISGKEVNCLGARYVFRSSVRTELGWGINYYKVDDPEQYLQGTYVTFGPFWRHTARNRKGFGFQFTLNLLGSIYSDVTSTPDQTDQTRFRAEINPELLLYQRVNIGKKICIFPAAGICTALSFFKKKEAEGNYSRGIIETRAVFKLPILFPVSKKSHIIIEPAYKYHLHSSMFEKMETFTIKVGISW